MKQLINIGTAELLNLPDNQIFDVPAKVDTGADKSSIWASNIRPDGGKLTFCLFAPGSVFYSGEDIATDMFRYASIRNSFGQKELRYKVRLQVQLGEHKLKRWFTLADRSRNAYGILLGKNLLKNKFVVDVSQKYVLSHPAHTNRVLVFGKHPDTVAFFEKVNLRNNEPTDYFCDNYDSLIFYFDGSNTHVINAADGGLDLATYSFIFFKSHYNGEFAPVAADYLRYKGRNFVDKELAGSRSLDKLAQLMKLNCAMLPLPRTICARTSQLKTRFGELSEYLGLPFVLKDIHSDRGKNNYLIGTQADFDTILRQARPSKKLTFVAQKFIPNDGFYRLNIFGNTTRLAIWRAASGHQDRLKSHLNKPSGGVNAQLLKLGALPSQLHTLAASAAACLNRQVAGVDLVQDKSTKKWYILEVNNGPQIRSGPFIDDKIRITAEFFDKQLGRL
ncbi:MAG: RimK/LysX family protein [Candidatus Saccharimonadales bacterium]